MLSPHGESKALVVLILLARSAYFALFVLTKASYKSQICTCKKICTCIANTNNMVFYLLFQDSYKVFSLNLVWYLHDQKSFLLQMVHLYCMQQDSNLRLLPEADYESAALTTQLYMLKPSAMCSLLFVLQNCSIIQVTCTLLTLCLMTIGVSLACKTYLRPPFEGERHVLSANRSTSIKLHLASKTCPNP